MKNRIDFQLSSQKNRALFVRKKKLFSCFVLLLSSVLFSEPLGNNLLNLETSNLEESCYDPGTKPDDTFSHIRFLSFSGGGGRGYAYYPTLKAAIEEYGLSLDKVRGAAGTSAGAIAALISLICDDLDILESIYCDIAGKNFGDFSWSNLIFFKSQLGVYEGDEMRNWLINHLYRQTGLFDPTFEQFYEFSGKHLKIFATNLSKSELVEFSHLKTPKESVVRSILISCALPMAFKPRKNIQGDTLVDGGLLKNLPIDSFDYIDSHGTRYANPTTLAFFIQAPKEHDDPCVSITKYLGAIIDALTHHESRSLSEVDKNRTIIVPCPKELSLTSLWVEQDTLDNIFQETRQAVHLFAQKYPYQKESLALWAAKRGYVDLLKNALEDVLNDNELEYELVDQQGNSILMLGLLYQKYEVVKYLLEHHQVDWGWKNKNNQNLSDLITDLCPDNFHSLIHFHMARDLHRAFIENKQEDIKALINLGAQVDHEQAHCLRYLIRHSRLKELEFIEQERGLTPFKFQHLLLALKSSSWSTVFFVFKKYCFKKILTLTSF